MKSSSIFHDRMIQTQRLRRWLLAGITSLCFANSACALDPARTMSQYVHDKWESDKGFPGGAVFAICQSQDGYLWIGTERGLVRFDGFDFTLIRRPISGLPAIGSVRGLLTDVEGNMWIRLDGPHLLLYRNGKFDDAIARFHPGEVAFTAMSLDNEGELLLWGPVNRLLRFRNGEFRNYVISPDIPGIVISMTETRDRKIWMGTRDMGLFQIDKGRQTNGSDRLAVTSINTLLSASGQGLWIGTDSGLEFRDGSGPANSGSFPSIGHLQILTSTRDQNGNIWVGTSHGLVRITSNRTVSTELINNNSDAGVTAVYEDRDGDIWFGGSHGIERLRDGMFTGYSTEQGLPSQDSGPIYVDSEGRTWFAPPSGGLYWLKEGRVTRVTIAGLDKDVIYSISGGGGEIWIGRQHGGLTVLTRAPASFVARTYTQSDGLALNSVYSVHRNSDGTIWAGTVNAGVSRLSNGIFTNYSRENGLESNAVFSIVEGYNGTMWFATPSGLESFDGRHWNNYAAANGLPSSNVRSIFEDSKHVLWIATSAGLAFFESGRIHVPDHLGDLLREEILGVAEDKQGSLWITTSDHVLEVSRDRLLAETLSDSDVRSFGAEDGLPGVEGVRRDRSLVAGPDGRIWISLAHGLAMADPMATAKSAVPVRVRIESISAGGSPVSLTASSKLRAGTHSITFNYANSNLSAPQKIRFRYRLDGADQGWSSDVPLRQVVYTNLAPGSYQFRIVASNGAGIWNGPETTVEFIVEPEFWQTWWFRVACLAALCMIAMGIYRLRMSQLTKRLNLRFQDRLAERTRIAQELHDTLLQGVLSATLQLDVVEDQTPDDSPTKPLLRRILELMGQVTEEGRNALRGLRTQESKSLSLETSLSRVRQEFASDEKASYRIISQVTSRPLRPMIRDEVYRIGREAVINAFLHAQANNIEVQVEYANRFLRILVRDDGCGIDPRVLDGGREGHWGLTGMRERSENIGASLKLRSRVGAGTEVELTVPGPVAYESQSRGSVLQWLAGFKPKRPASKPERRKGEETNEHSSPDSHS
ncbi:MAG: two-component regulator propeller domain-containing protein [Terracidiphilus sp.]